MRFWIGTYPSRDGVVPPAEGVWRVDLLDDGTLVDRGRAAALAQASFVAVHPTLPVLYATQEAEPGGAVAAFATGDPDDAAMSLRPLVTVPAGGGYPCHLEVLGSEVLVSCYGSGAPGSAVLGSVPLSPDGAPAGDARTHGHDGAPGPHADRQDASHVHSATLAPGGTHVWAADLGTDQLVRYRVTDAGVTADGVTARMPAGSGPRHLVLLPDDVAIVACELDSTVAVVRLPGADGGPDGEVLQVLPACATPAGDGPSQPSHITLNDAGTRLHVGVRGQDVLATFAVERGDDGVALTHLADTPCGEWPRHHAVLAGAAADRDVVVVAAQGGHELVALEIGADGSGRVLSRLTLPVRPSCVVPV
ncbi:6-phosphogluconolactonase (cycloisomerase 2 family) [Flavimobilis soli]|uniref:6-phosphogluconolactonase (Cycloisomerase 2 family) n=1 Tax=Flavimobilis soli TaxID=442709 RepID=A0A2A9EGH5_9MICO|nr:beta-propeller fold lactonase family protein [Flavimobilis soli]PFG37332.1 6-phosphogluconolactonase (cycloisomerase 2 family) [Flavimobilis soli]